MLVAKLNIVSVLISLAASEVSSESASIYVEGFKLTLNGSNNEQLSNPNHSTGTEQVCEEGFYLKYRRRKPHGPSKFKTNQFACEPCNCNIYGSKSKSCDKRSGRCFCFDNHIGILCDQCSPGYYNSSLQVSNPKLRPALHPSDNSWGRCVECGPCYLYNNADIAELHNSSVELMKRASGFGQSLISQLSATDSNNQSGIIGLTMSTNGAESFTQLETKLSSISDIALMNKYYADRLNYMASEIESLTYLRNYVNLNISDLQHRVLNHGPIIYRLEDYLYSTEEIVSDLVTLTDRFKSDQLYIEDGLLLDAHESIKQNVNRSRHAMATLDLRDKFIAELDDSIEDLSKQAESIERSKADLESNSLKIINELLQSNEIGATVNETLSQILTDDISNPLKETIEISQSLTAKVESKMESLLPETDNISRGLDMDRVLILETIKIAQFIEDMLSQARENISLVSSNISDSNMSFGQLLDNAIQMLRLDIDKIDAKWTSAQLEMSQVVQVAFDNHKVDKVVEISKAINQTLRSNNATLASMFKEFESELTEAASLKHRAQTLTSNLRNLNGLTVAISKLRNDASTYIEQTKTLNSNTRYEISSVKSLLMLDDSQANSRVLKTVDNSSKFDLSSEIAELRDRMTKLQSLVLGKQLYSKQTSQRHSEELKRVNAINRDLSKDIRNGLDELSTLSSIIQPTSPEIARNPPIVERVNDLNITLEHHKPKLNELTIRRAQLLDKQRRKDRLVKTYRVLSKDLHSCFSKTSGLEQEFRQNQLTFDHFEKILRELHSEVNTVTANIKSKLQLLDQTC